jgi:DNA helicase HerA-like ATPase
LAIEQQGADKLFGEPALNLEDFIQTSPEGQGIVNILVADDLIQAPSRYATFLLWLLADLFEKLPEVGDPPKPKLIFFFDEAHLLFEDAPKALVEKIEQVVRLIRSKGVGVYFVTQNPMDLPDRVLGQLGNRVQHALRAFSPRDQKTGKAAAETFRANPKLNVVEAITELGVGEALISVLDEKGIPTKVDRAWVLPPQSRLTPLTPAERDQVLKASKLFGVYEQIFDRESAYEVLKRKTELIKAEQALQEAEEAARKAQKRQPPTPSEQAGKILIDMGKSAARSAGTQIGRQILRGIFGTLFGGK